MEVGKRGATDVKPFASACLLLAIVVVLHPVRRGSAQTAASRLGLRPSPAGRLQGHHLVPAGSAAGDVQVPDLRRSQGRIHARRRRLARADANEAPGLSRGGPGRRPEPREGTDRILKVGSVVMRELTAAASLEGIVVGGPIGGGLSRPSPRGPVSRRRSAITGQPDSPGWGRPDQSISIPPRTRIPFPCLIRGRIRDGVNDSSDALREP